MRNFLKLISFTSALLLAGISNQIYSSERKKIDFNSNILISSAIEEKEIKTVTANGFGTSLESAAQNAAENALTNVVGSFLDVETLLKEKTTIFDGILRETTIIKENINDYSQGKIKYFEILDIQQNGSIFNVTARVDVRIDDFKAYIRKLAKVETELESNLFTRIKTERDNRDNKIELFKKAIFPIRNGEVFSIKQVSKEQILDEISVFECKIQDTSNDVGCAPNGFRSQGSFNLANFSRRDTIVIPYSMQLKENFIINLRNTLENISENKETQIIKYDNTFRISNTNFFSRINNLTDYALILHNSELKTRDIYLLNGFKSLINENFFNEFFQKQKFPKIKLSFFDAGKQIRCIELMPINGSERELRKTLNCLNSKIKIGYIKPPGKWSDWVDDGVLIDQLSSDGVQSFGVFDKIDFLMFIEPSDEFIEIIKNISLEIVKN